MLFSLIKWLHVLSAMIAVGANATYAILFVVGLFGYTPTLKRQIQALTAEGSASTTYQSIAGRSTTIGIVLAVIAISSVFLMVVKPTLWA